MNDHHDPSHRPRDGTCRSGSLRHASTEPVVESAGGASCSGFKTVTSRCPRLRHVICSPPRLPLRHCRCPMPDAIIHPRILVFRFASTLPPRHFFVPSQHILREASGHPHHAFQRASLRRRRCRECCGRPALSGAICRAHGMSQHPPSWPHPVNQATDNDPRHPTLMT